MPPNMANSSGWHVVGQQETMGLDPMGRAVDGVKVTFQTDRGLTGTVFVPRDRYNPDNVKAAILQAVGSLHTVQDLRG
jgi:hypothetical protein